jgi:hypothetical protein
MIFRPITCIEDKFAKIENSVCNLYSRENKTTLNSEKAWDSRVLAWYWFLIQIVREINFD